MGRKNLADDELELSGLNKMNSIMSNDQDVKNIFGIIAFFVVMQVMRVLLETLESKTSKIHKTLHPLKGVYFDSAMLIVAFTFMYVGGFIFRQTWVKVPASLIAIAGIVFELKFRFVDDIARGVYRLDSKTRGYKIEDNPHHFIVRHLIDHIFRSYIYIAYFFSVIYAVCIPGKNSLSSHSMADYLILDADSGNTFLELFVFSFTSILTLGSDIVRPVSGNIKLVWMIEIAIGTAFVGLIIGLFSNTMGEIIDSIDKEQIDDFNEQNHRPWERLFWKIILYFLLPIKKMYLLIKKLIKKVKKKFLKKFHRWDKTKKK